MKIVQKKEVIIGTILSIVIPFVVVACSLSIWSMDFNCPPSFSGDGTLCQMLIKSISDYGLKGLWINKSLGAPEFSSLVDTPFLDFSFGLEVFLYSRFIKSSAKILYFVYIMSFPLAGFFSYFLIYKKLTDNQIINAVAAIFFSILPYHFSRGMGHLTLSRYFTVPIAVFIALTVHEEEMNWGLPKNWGRCKRICFLLLCILVGLGNVYYVYGGLILIATVSLLKGIRFRRASVLYNEMMAAYYVILGFLIGMLPKISYTFKYGINELAGRRPPSDTEMYGLKIIQMLLPCYYNRVPFLASLNRRYTAGAFNINENIYSSLGLSATIGFLIICVWIIIKFSGRARNDSCAYIKEKVDLIAFLVLSLVLFATTGGIGTIVSYCITPEIRALNRLCIMIACLSIAVLDIFTVHFLSSLKEIEKKALFWVIISAFAAFVIYSEVLFYGSEWQWNLKDQNTKVESFFKQVDDLLPEGAMVYQLPYVDFPESGPIANMPDYEPGIAYLYTSGLRWSYGAMKGRDTRAADLFIDQGMSQNFVNSIKDAGFRAVYIDTNGFYDGGTEIINFYSEQLGLTPIISDDGWLYLYILK